MAINIGDNFSYQGKKYLDDRQSFKTLSELRAYSNVPEGFIAYCEENKTRYEYKDGEWSEYVVTSTGGVIDESVATKSYVDELIETHTHEEYDVKFDDVGVSVDATTSQNVMDFYANGEIVKTVRFSSGGGSGGSPYISTELSENVLVEVGSNLELNIDFYSPTPGNGTLKVFINNIESLSTSVEQGVTSLTVTEDKLSKGTNQMVVYVIDRSGTMSNSLTFYVRYGSLEFSSDFDSATAYDYGSTIRYYFTPTALDTSASLTFYMKIDGAVQTGVTCTSDVRSYFTFANNMNAGAHYCECWVENQNGSKSNIETFTLVILDVNTLVVVSKTRSVSIEEGAQLSLDYRVYKKNETSFTVKTYINDSLVSTGTCGTSTTYYRTTSLLKGMYTIRIEVWDITETYSDSISWSVTITPSTYTMLEPAKAGGLFLGTAQNRTNGDGNRDVFVGYDQDGQPVNAALYNFSYNNESGWVDDQLLVTGNSYVEVPIKPLAANARYGFTLDVEFSARHIGADEAEVLSIWNDEDNCGVKITQEQLILQSKSGNKCELYFTENETVSAIFVIDRTEKTAKIYLNGVMCSAFALSDYTIDEVTYLEDFAVDEYLYLGGKGKNGYAAIKNLRVYEIALTSSEILTNFMSNEKDKTEQRALVDFQKGEDLPTVTVYCDFSGLGKDDKKYCDIIYNSPDPSKYGESFALTGKHSQLQYQGTSSMQYPIKNYRLNPRDADGKVAIKLPFCQPETRFTLKADFMSSGHWQNTGLTKWVNNNLYDYDENNEKSMNPAKWWALQNGKDPNDYRECIYGFPCRLILVNDGDSPLNEGQQEPTPGNTKDMGVFNFNLDKDCENSLGFTIPDFPNAVSMEVTANSDTSAGAFMSKDLSDAEQLAYLQESFELRYGNEDVDGWGFLGMEIDGVWSTEHSLKALIDWVDKSTDEEFVAEFEEHFHKDYTLRYYILVILLGMVDNLGKNMMLDSYDGKIWMPRFYDCDTICSYDNSGAIKFDVDIEMEQGYWNTSSSRLWTRIRDLFHDEIIAKYNSMRQKGLNYESFMSVFYDEQIAKIPQKYYNQDADVKYIPYADEYLGKAHGDGYEHLKRWLKGRIMFVDTLYDYTPSYTNDMITFRANTTQLMTITIETYNPVYQHVSWYNGNMEKGKIGRGTKFTFSGHAQAATDQEILVYGGSNIKRITGISTLNPDSMLIGNATKLVELDVSGSPLLTDINSNKANLTAHTYLTKLNISDCPNLVGSLRLNYSPLIQEINAKNTGITDLQLPSSIRNLKTLRVPGALTNLTLNDASSLETLEFDGNNQLQVVSMTNCNALTNVINFDLTTIPNVTLNNSYDVEELYMSITTNLSLINMSNIKRLIYLPNNEYETFNLTQLRNSTNYTISAVNCPNLKTFITTAPQRQSYTKDNLTHNILPNSVFSANIFDMSNTKITDIKFLCTTDIYELKLPATVNNFICDSAFDIDTRHVADASFNKIHRDLIEAYTNPDYYFRYNEPLTDIIVPTASDGSLIFIMYAPDVNSANPGQGIWDLYGLKFEEFYTYGMNNNIIYTGTETTMTSRLSSYNISIKNAMIEPTRYPMMLYPLLVNEDSPITGTIDYEYYAGNDLSYAMAYANKNEVDIIIPSDVLINATYTHRIDQDSEYTYFHPNTVAAYTTFAPGVIPSFNSAFRLYSVSETDNGNGTYSVIITASINGDAPTSINFTDCVELYSVEYINTTKLNSIAHMFTRCMNLVRIDGISGWDTSKVTLMTEAFAECSNLISLDLSGWDTSNVSEMQNMFSYCTNLISLDVSGWNTSKVTNMSYMFQNCSSLASLDVSGWNTSSVTNISGVFSGCSNLTSLDISGFNTSKVTSMNSVFNGCRGLTSLDVSEWDTSLVTVMINLFQSCSSLTSLNLSGWNTSLVTAMRGMFHGCSSLISLDISVLNTSSVTDMSSMFHGCSSLISLDISVLNTSSVTDMSGMFYGCSSLTSLDLSGWDTSRVTNADILFSGCSNLTTLKWTNWRLQTSLSSLTRLSSDCIRDLIGNLAKVQLVHTLELNYTISPYLNKGDIIGAKIKNWNLTCTESIEFANISATVNLSDVNDSSIRSCAIELTNSNKYTRIDEVVNAYKACDDVYLYDDGSVIGLNSLFNENNTIAKTKITSLYFISGFFNGVNDVSYMFNGCSNLTILDVSRLDTSNVTNMTSVFNGCSSLTSLDVSRWDTSRVTTMNSVFNECFSLTTLDVSNWNTSNVTRMISVFRSCNNITSLDLSGWDTSKVTNTQTMFQYCYGLTSLDLSEWGTSGINDIANMFNNCTNLISLDLSGWNTSNVINMTGVFNSCSSLISLDLSGWNTSSTTTTKDMFRNCSSLTTLDLSGWNTSLVTDMSGMFHGCSSLISLDLSGWDTLKVTSMNDMFYGCSRLTSLNMSNWDTINVTNMYNMFCNCSGLTILDVSGFDTSKVTTMDSMFSGCTGLTSIDLSGFDTFMLSSIGGMFYGCSGLTSLDLSGFDTSNVTNMSNIFNGCTNLTSLDVSGWDTSLVTNMNSMFKNCSKLTFIDLGGWSTSLVTDMNSMFNNCSNLTTLDLGGFDTSKVTDTMNMFNGCTRLTTLKWSNWMKSVDLSSTRLTEDCVRGLVVNLGYVNESATLTLSTVLNRYLREVDVLLAHIKNWTISNMSVPAYGHVWAEREITGVINNTYSKCVIGLTESNKYTRIDEALEAFPACNEVYLYDDGSVTSLAALLHENNANAGLQITKLSIISGYFTNVDSTSSMFQGCRSLTSLDLSGWDTSKVTNMSYMFYDCTNLTSLDLSGWDTSKVTNMGYMFYYCTNLTSLDVSGWDTSKVTNMNGVFGVCSNLTSLDVSGWDTSRVTDMSSLFFKCSNLTSLDLSKWDTSSVIKIGSMFNNCSSLTSLDLSGFDTSKVTTMDNIFRSCYNLTSVDVSGFDTSNVTNMELMFHTCNSLTSLDVSGWNTSKVTNMASLFSACASLTSLDLSGWYVLKVSDMSSMFANCVELETLDITGWDTSSVIKIGSMFNNCSSLTSLDLSGWNTSNVTTMDNIFSGCINLKSLDLTGWETSKIKTTANAFSSCDRLTSLKWTNWKPSVDVSKTALSSNSVIEITDQLASVTEPQTLTLGVTLLSYLSDTHIALATSKGWTLVG